MAGIRKTRSDKKIGTIRKEAMKAREDIWMGNLKY